MKVYVDNLIATLLLLVPIICPAQVTFMEYPPLPAANSYPASIAAGPDGNLWFTEVGKIGRITKDGVLSEFPVGGVDSGVWITSGPDGNMWFTTSYGKINKISTAGVITTVASLPFISSPDGIATGPDGNLWFTEYGGNNIGRITTSGVTTIFPIPTSSSSPTGITKGPDGNLWFTEQSANKIGKITTSGVITEFSIPTSSSLPAEITAGPDGSLWFTEVQSHKIGRITTAGVIREFSLPASTFPLYITAGPDGNVWFTDGENSASTSNQVSSINTSGIVTEYTVPTSASQPADITTGPDGNLWFTEIAGNRIAKASLSASPCSGINIDTSQANALIKVTLAGGCDGILTIQNNRNFWTNFQISTIGYATAIPVGGDANAYAAARLLPPSGLAGSSTAVQYYVHFSNKSDLITVFVDPSGQTANGYAKNLNIVQTILYALPLNSTPQLVIANYQTVLQSFQQMPHLNNADAALFSNPPNVLMFLKELGRFFASGSEQSAFANMVEDIAIANGTAFVKQGLLDLLASLVGQAARITWVSIQEFGNIINFGFRYTAGSVFLTAQ